MTGGGFGPVDETRREKAKKRKRERRERKERKERKGGERASAKNGPRDLAARGRQRPTAVTDMEWRWEDDYGVRRKTD